MKRYPVPAQEIRRELIVVNSRFIATLAPAFTVEQAKAFIARIRSEFKDASHNVPAFLIGYGDSVIAHCNDNGEPSGTAGQPVLAVLRGSGLGDVAVVVTRYFGGTKLGTGGLVRAYSDAVRLVLKDMVRAEKVITHTIILTIPYNLFERVRKLVTAHHGRILDEDFGSEVTITARFEIEYFPTFQTGLQNLSKGVLQAEIIETKETLMPINPSA
jgi:uncharacterized YigZ family protein